jgi:8-amino-7-oxononanoate synthase
LPPAIVASVSRALSLIESKPELRAALLAHARRLHAGLAAAGFSLGAPASPVVSIRMPDPAVAGLFWNRLLEAGFYVNLALPPATPSSQSLLRMSVTAVHTRAQIDAVISGAVAIGRELGVVADGRPGMRHAAE